MAPQFSPAALLLVQGSHNLQGSSSTMPETLCWCLY